MTSAQITVVLAVMVPLVTALTTWVGLQIRQLQRTAQQHTSQLNGPTLVMNDRIAALERAMIGLMPPAHNRRASDTRAVEGVPTDATTPAS